MDDHLDAVFDVLHSLYSFASLALTVLDDRIGIIFLGDIANSLLSALGVHDDLGGDARSFSRKHPLACWLSVCLNFFAGGIISNILLGEPVLDFILNNPIQLRNIFVLTFAWWFVFHAPSHIGYSLINCFPVKLILSLMKEVYRSHKIYNGVSQIGKVYQKQPYNHLLMVINGTLKGNGGSFMMIIGRLLRGVWLPKTELLQPSFSTKITFFGAIIFMINAKTDILLPDNDHYLKSIIAAAFVVCNLVSMARGSFDPFIPVENTLCHLFLGGNLDSPEVVQKKKKKKTA